MREVPISAWDRRCVRVLSYSYLDDKSTFQTFKHEHLHLKVSTKATKNNPNFPEVALEGTFSPGINLLIACHFAHKYTSMWVADFISVLLERA